ncbi:MAG: T9SS type A sorting domain-containing protein [Bacteroidales bacterium]|nr:T9SS type A sorting domain-containing protein [Bacteroidales bacterium]
MLAFILQGVFVLNSYAQIPPPWKYINTGNNHSILIPNNDPVLLNNDSLAEGDYIGVFYDSLGQLACGGYIEWHIDTVATAVTAWGEDVGLDGFATGEVFKWKIWDSSKGKEYKALAKYGDNFWSYDTYASNGMSGLISLYAYPDQNIELHEGWNYFSSYITPLNADLELMLTQVDSLLIKITDFNGVVYGPGIDFTAPVYYKAGNCYKIKMNDPGTLNMYGFQPKAEDSLYFLSGSPSVLPYMREEAASVEALFDQNIDHIELIKDENGRLYWPEMDQISLNNLYPGQAYKIICNADFYFSYPDNDTVLPISSPQETNSTVYYIADMSTGENMSLGIEFSAWDNLPLLGDEVGVFTSNGKLVGSGVFEGKNMGLTLWGDDLTTSSTDGLLAGEVFKLKLWNKIDGFEDDIKVTQWQQGDNVYFHDRVAVISALEIKQNPEDRAFGFEVISDFANHSFTVAISMEEADYVNLYIYNLQGQQVRVLVSENLPIGKHPFKFFLYDTSSGVYIFSLQSKTRSEEQKVPFFRFD